MFIIGEGLNSSNARVKEALERSDWAAIGRMARQQEAAGARALDVNAGAMGSREEEVLLRMVEAVTAATDLPLCLDTAKPPVMEAVAAHCPQAGLILNSATLDDATLAPMAELASRLGVRLVVLAMTKGSPLEPEAAEDALAGLVSRLAAAGLPQGRVWVDPVVLPLAYYPEDVTRLTGVLSCIRTAGFGAVCGLSNISFAMPRRRALNRALLPTLMERGLEHVILDPCDGVLMDMARAGEALFSEGEGVIPYLRSLRK